MDRFVTVTKRKRTPETEIPSSSIAPSPQQVPSICCTQVPSSSNTNGPEVPSTPAPSPHIDSTVVDEFSTWDLQTDPGMRKPISSYHPNDQDKLLDIVSREGTREARGEAYALLKLMPTFDFVFTLFLVKSVLGITNQLSQALQRKDQDIVNAMNLVRISKIQLQEMRDKGWDNLMHDISAFCAENNIVVPEMTAPYVAIGRGRRNVQEETNLHHFQVDFFNSIIDFQIAALNGRFDEVNTELLLCMSHLNPSDRFSAFDKGALIRLAKLYPTDFSQMDIMLLDQQLDTFYADVVSSNDFIALNGISGLAQKMVETKRDLVYPHVYLLITLSLILPVATATVERAFSAMDIVKNRLRNRIGNELLNNCLLTYIEREVFRSISNDRIITRFQDKQEQRVVACDFSEHLEQLRKTVAASLLCWESTGLMNLSGDISSSSGSAYTKVVEETLELIAEEVQKLRSVTFSKFSSRGSPPEKITCWRVLFESLLVNLQLDLICQTVILGGSTHSVNPLHGRISYLLSAWDRVLLDYVAMHRTVAEITYMLGDAFTVSADALNDLLRENDKAGIEMDFDLDFPWDKHNVLEKVKLDLNDAGVLFIHPCTSFPYCPDSDSESDTEFS